MDSETNEQAQTEETQAQAPEVPETEAPETEAPEAEAKEGEGQEEESPEGEAPEASQAKPEEKHKRAGGWQRKIERLERQNEMLMQQLTSTTRPPAPPAEPAKPPTPEQQLQELLSSAVRNEFQVIEAQREQQARLAAFQERTQAVRAEVPDFDEVMEGAAHTPMSTAVRDTLLTSPVAPKIMYTLAKNPGELARINRLPPLDAAREIGRLEAQASVTAAPRTETKSAKRPPAPPTNVGGSSASTRDLEDLPLAEYKRAFRSKR